MGLQDRKADGTSTAAQAASMQVVGIPDQGCNVQLNVQLFVGGTEEQVAAVSKKLASLFRALGKGKEA